MEAQELIGKELDEMRQALRGAQERLVQLQSEVEQLSGAVAFGEYLLEKLREQGREPAEENEQ